ncbi:TOMM system kinase/cyclase fusion protein [Thalassomonas sp. RHCl1]|uniref:TOMM system kinase/cyclase fusion protein n=1 Tax=Thalassomonas sp. RHCl1 TaxID=2995320 RepID=UPI00248C280F|nr:TOMM system kinase/cyclase fusion protein [Thalassomonas sp. RHCl1]
MTITINTLEAELGFVSDAYRLVRKIGQGGFGQVYLAKQLNTNQDVAIKFLSVSSDFDEAKKKRYIERFDRETLLCSRLQHPNIVRLLDKGCCHDNLLYAVFEYVDGKTLKQTLADSGALLPLDAAAVMGQVLDALAHAHEQGVIHRDIKPANIMLTKVGAKIHAKVLDFGIGTLVNEVRQLDYKSITLTQETLGTPSYSAPEQLRGEPPTPKTDIYVWGLVFIECLTGQPAISGTSLASVFHKQLSQSNVPLPASLAGHSVSALLRRVLNKKASERAADAAELYHEFHQLNFSTLVGELNQHTSEHFSTDNTLVVQPGDNETLINETLITDNSAVHSTYASLTERKQITALAVVLNVKSIGDTQPDGEVVDAIHRDQKAQCIDTAIRYGAFHVGSLGNTLLFYYGYPAVSDNDSRLCARTALEISSQLSHRNSLLRQNQGIEIRLHMGMHTGIVTTYADATPEGDTANIALDLARLAADNQVLITQNSKLLLDSYLTFQPQQVQIVGITPQPRPLYSLIGERQVEAFGFLRGNKNNHDFIGREQELAWLKSLVDTAENQGNNQNNAVRCAHVFGEAGIGKSRLVFELRNDAQSFSHYVTQCLPEYQNNALFPVLNLIKYKYSLDTLAPEDGSGKLRDEMLGLDPQDSKGEDAFLILCSWLGLPLPQDIQVKPLSPDMQKQILFDALAALLLGDDPGDANETHHRRLFLFEDLHWADPTTLEFIARLSTASQGARDVFISTSRQPLPEVLTASNVKSIALNKLSQEKTAQFVVNLFDKQQVSANLLDVVVSRTDGIPLFIEELVNMLKQKSLVRHLNGITDFVDPDNINEVPGSLRDSLQQKLDTLVYAKETAQLAATIGREFEYKLLAAASNHSEAQLQTDLNELIEADLIILQRKVAGDSYIFKHALVRDAAYDSMLKEQRIKSHAVVASMLESDLFDLSQINFSLIAQHYALAEVFAKAVEFGILAAESMLKQSASQESITQAETALVWLEQLPGGQQTLHKLQINSILTTAHMQVSGWAAEEVKYYTDSSIALLKSEGEDYRQSRQLNSDFVTHLWWKLIYGLVVGDRGDLADVEAELEDISRFSSDSDRAAALSCLGYFRYTGGDCQGGRQAMEAASKIAFDDTDAEHLSKYGWNSRVFALSTLGRIYWDLGEVSLALEHAELGLAKAREIAHIPSVAIALMYAAIVNQYVGNREKTLLLASELVSLSDEYELPIYQAYGGLIQAWASGDMSKEADYREILDANYSKHAVPYFSSLIADVFIANGDPVSAVSRYNACIELCREIGEYYYLPQLYWKLAQCRLQHFEHEQDLALTELRQGLSVAQDIGAKYSEHLITTDISTLLNNKNEKLND